MSEILNLILFIVSFIALVAYIVLSSMYFLNDTGKYHKYKNTYTTVLYALIMVSLFAGVFYNYLSYFSRQDLTFIRGSLTRFGILITSIVLVTVLIQVLLTYPKITDLALYLGYVGCIIGISIVSFGVLYYMAKSTKNPTILKIYSFFPFVYKQFQLFYNWAMTNIKQTKKEYYYILFGSLAFVALYLLYPLIQSSFFKKIYYYDSLHALDNPIYLHSKQVLFQDAQVKKLNSTIQNFCLTCDVYIEKLGSDLENQDDQNGFTFFQYGSTLNANFDPKNNNLIITCKGENNDTNVIYQTDNFDLQKWNSLIFNFRHGKCDVFLNKKLVGTSECNLNQHLVNNISVGNPNLYGGIKNVSYIPHSISRYHINLL